MKVTICDSSARSEWDAYVDGSSPCWHYQLYGWKQAIEEVYGHECPYLVARDTDRIVGILPLAVVKSRLLGKSVTSLPFLDTGGVEAESPAARDALVDEALRIACDRGVDYLELRQSREIPGEFRVDTYKASLTMSLRTTVEEQWDSAPSERRNRVRKARKAGLRAEFAGPERLSDFYRVWSHNMRDLGSPAHSRRWFEVLLETFREHMTLLLIRDDQDFAGAALVVEYKGMLAVPWVSSLRRHFGRHPNDLLYWEAIKRGVEQGCQRFDFGRSTIDSGNFTYKVRWGAEAAPIYWQYRALAKGQAALPSEESAKYSIAVNLWKRIPVGLANRIGPRIRKGITR